MRIIVQRVKRASCIVDGNIVSSINKGYMLLVGLTHSDTIDNVKELARKVNNLRIFSDEMGKMNLNIHDSNGEILSISQFTLYGDAKKGNRPSYINALGGDKATILYDEFNKKLRQYVHVETGIFGADMCVNITNDGPVTILLEREE